MEVNLIQRWEMAQVFVAAWITEQTCNRMDMIINQNPDRFKNRADFVRGAILSYVHKIEKSDNPE